MQSTRRNATIWILTALTGLALVLNLWGTEKNLPYVPEVDEKTYFVGIPVSMAARGSLNPGWFGHPGSTLFYPLAGIYRLLYGSQAQQAFESNPLPFYYLGRGLSIVYAVLSLPITFLVGRRVFGERVGLVGVALFALYPLAVAHAQVARTDSAAVFWGMVSLWRIFELRQAPSLKNQLMAGTAIGLSISSRFFMISLVPLLVVVEILSIRQAKNRLKHPWLEAAAGIFAVALAFVLTSPYLFLDINTALESLQAESRSLHLGADGLTRPGNLLWYLGQAIPRALTWLQYALALAGMVIVFIRRETAQLLLVGYLGIFVALISLAALHWAHWLIPVLPILALLAAFGLETLVRSTFRAPAAQTGALIIGTLVIAAHPAYQVILHDIRESRPSTRVQAREWALANLPAGSAITEEWYAAPLDGAPFRVTEHFTLAQGGDLEDYVREGYDYLIASSAMYGRYFDEAQRYPREVAFYEKLFGQGELVQEFVPGRWQAGPTIRIYRVTESLIK